jgi:dTDP-4-amino-4,6-dideoxygalactose transaminase
VSAPRARYRLYTSWDSYLPFLRDLLALPKDSDPVEEFRQELSGFLDGALVTTVPMCRTGIYLAVKHVIDPGQEVVMSPYTIADAVNMVIAAGGRPVFADIERSTCNLSVESVDSLVHAGTGAVVVTHLHGIPAPIQEIAEICRSKRIPVIEDAAQAFGARAGGQRLGTVGDAGVYSFGTYKNITGWYGGAITCKDPDLFSAIKQASDRFAPQSKAFLVKRVLMGLATDIATHPLVFRSLVYWIFRFGLLYDVRWLNRFVETELDVSWIRELPESYFGQMTAAQHELCLRKLEGVDRDNEVRARKANRYRQGLEGIDGILLPPSDSGSAIYTYFPVQYGDGEADRRRLLRHLARHGCDIGAQHLKNCADLPAFREFRRDCPNAGRSAETVLLLPTYPTYPDWNVDRNLAALRDYASASAA